MAPKANWKGSLYGVLNHANLVLCPPPCSYPTEYTVSCFLSTLMMCCWIHVIWLIWRVSWKRTDQLMAFGLGWRFTYVCNPLKMKLELLRYKHLSYFYIINTLKYFIFISVGQIFVGLMIVFMIGCKPKCSMLRISHTEHSGIYFWVSMHRIMLLAWILEMDKYFLSSVDGSVCQTEHL